MPKLVINGQNRIVGEITVQGAKNSVLPIIAATILCKGESIIHNCPELSDVEVSLKIIKALGGTYVREGNDVVINTDGICCNTIPDELMREMRSSVVFLGAILARCEEAIISTPGGCELGPRPIDLHISSLEKLGAEIKEEHGFLRFASPNGLKGAEITLSFPSVGATENIILASCTLKGRTVIHNAAREPEISNLADFLNCAGARIYGAGSDIITINGVDKLHSAELDVIPDRIAASTYMSAAAITGGDIILTNIMPSHMVSLISFFTDTGCEISLAGKTLRLKAPKRLKRVPTVRTTVYPGFPTDAGPTSIAMLSKALGTSVFVENIFENRFKYIDELKRFGAKIKTEGRVAIVEGVDHLSAANCECTDLRGGAALVVSALAANGITKIDKIHHIYRGYENIVGNLACLGADVYEEE